ncbi:methyltransferase domain-containing protein [Alicyclobacillus tolerans]|uniref:Tellurite methyltransferase n=1 Tax=Alicyclobacillus tolerans TaxID=90970 RepID=A0A1M6LP46_9BACL|nr:methyltransferase domain-containing protein [Alicyclobacillus montanus]SHJ72976.1 tellurite methyltransferase [Alicyclobacillus montanus]
MAMETYDEVYSKPEFYWGQEPNNLCKRAVKLIEAKGKVIDLGCGEGKDMIHFARNGFDAVGVDLSKPGLQKAEKWAEKEGLQVATVQANINEFNLTAMFDVVYSSGTLTYIVPTLRHDMFMNYKEHTNVGGFNVFNVFVEKPFIETAPDWGTDEYFYRSGDLLSFYWDWEIISFEEVIFDCNSSGVPHKHAMDVMIARKTK